VFEKLKYWKFCVLAEIASHFKMVHVPVDIIRECMAIEAYFQWLLDNLECDGPTKEELQLAKDTHTKLLVFLQAGKSYVK